VLFPKLPPKQKTATEAKLTLSLNGACETRPAENYFHGDNGEKPNQATVANKRIVIKIARYCNAFCTVASAGNDP